VALATGSFGLLIVLVAPNEAPIMSVIITLVVLYIGFRLAYQILPPAGQHLIGTLLAGIGFVVREVGNVLVRTGYKGRR
jgi:hypothetical protein